MRPAARLAKFERKRSASNQSAELRTLSPPSARGWSKKSVPKEKREHMDALSEESGESDKLYQEARLLSHRFRDGLLALFFDEKSGMEELTKIYGVS